MALTKEQKKIAKTLINIGKRRGESPRDIVTAIATGLVESNLTNIKGGDRDSSGWRQERAMYYDNPNNVKASTNRFYDELDAAGPGSIGARAQEAQGSAFPERYGERVQEARAILKQLNTGRQGGAQGVRGRGSVGKGVGTKVTIPGQSFEGERKAAALEFIKNRFQPGAVEAFAAQKQELQDVKPTTVSIPGAKGKVEKSKKAKSQTQQVGGERLKGGAIDIGTEVAKKFGLTVTSTTGGTHTPGSYHYSNRAIDISGTPAQMAKAYRYIRKNVPHRKLTELFYDPAGVYFDNGQKVKGAIGDHSDHIHLAI